MQPNKMDSSYVKFNFRLIFAQPLRKQNSTCSPLTMLRFLALSSSLFSERLGISSQYEFSSLFVMWPIKLHNIRVLLMCGSAVMGLQCEWEGAEHTALEGSGVIKK